MRLRNQGITESKWLKWAFKLELPTWHIGSSPYPAALRYNAQILNSLLFQMAVPGIDQRVIF